MSSCEKFGLVFCFLDIKGLIGKIYDLASRKTLLEVLYQGIQTLPPFLPCWTCRPLRQVMLARWKYVNSLILSKQAWVIFFFFLKKNNLYRMLFLAVSTSSRRAGVVNISQWHSLYIHKRTPGWFPSGSIYTWHFPGPTLTFAIRCCFWLPTLNRLRIRWRNCQWW